MKSPINQSFKVLVFSVLVLGISTHAMDSDNYRWISNAQQALTRIQKNDDKNAILVSPARTEYGQTVIQINRGYKDQIVQTGEFGIHGNWSGSVGSSTGKIDFSKKPAHMSAKEFIDECGYKTVMKFYKGSGIYELSIQGKRKEITLNGNIGFEIRKLDDGSILILLESNTSNVMMAYSVQLDSAMRWKSNIEMKMPEASNSSPIQLSTAVSSELHSLAASISHLGISFKKNKEPEILSN